jgi:PKD repeat protein
LPDSQELRVSVNINKQTYAKGEQVDITIVLSNSGPNQATLHFSTTCQSTFKVEDDSRIWYDESRHVACGLAFTEVTVPPGGTVSYSFTWNQVDDGGNQVPVPHDLLVKGIILHIDDIPPLEGTTLIMLRNGGSAPVAAFTWEPCVFCMAPGNVVFFNANVTVGSITQYAWNFGDGSAPVNRTEPFTSHIFFSSRSGSTVSLKVFDANGMTDRISHQVSFSIIPGFTFQPEKPVTGEPVTFNASATVTYGPEIVNFQWAFGDGSTGSGKLTSHSYTSPGIYRVVLTILTTDGDFSLSKAFLVAVGGNNARGGGRAALNLL